jgi:hypothetical protein
MEDMRALLRSSLGRSLEAMPDLDRLVAAWPVACGRALAGRGEVRGYVEGIVMVEVADGSWMQQLKSMERQLAGEMGRIARVKVGGIHFETKGMSRR